MIGRSENLADVLGCPQAVQHQHGWPTALQDIRFLEGPMQLNKVLKASYGFRVAGLRVQGIGFGILQSRV